MSDECAVRHLSLLAHYELQFALQATSQEYFRPPAAPFVSPASLYSRNHRTSLWTAFSKSSHFLFPGFKLRIFSEVGLTYTALLRATHPGFGKWETNKK